MIPYAGVNNDALANYLTSGRRLERPDYCPETVYNLWLRCWSYDQTERPTFVDIVAEIDEYISSRDANTLQTTIPSDAVYLNVANGQYYNETSDQEDSSSQATSSRAPVNNILKAPAEIPQFEATPL